MRRSGKRNTSYCNRKRIGRYQNLLSLEIALRAAKEKRAQLTTENTDPKTAQPRSNHPNVLKGDKVCLTQSHLFNRNPSVVIPTSYALMSV